jgi:hypothetical protein
MIEVIDGEAGSGKTWFQTHRILHKEWQSGQDIFLNYEVFFSKLNEGVKRFYQLEEIYHVRKGVLAFDEAQDLFGYWESMPISFRNLIAHHRHRGLIAIVNCQSFHDLHVEFRRNTHVRYTCRLMFRFPFRENVKPYLMMIAVKRRKKIGTLSDGEPRFEKRGKTHFYFISKFWTKTLYDTHSNIDNTRYLCELTFNKPNPDKSGQWDFQMTDREILINRQKR